MTIQVFMLAGLSDLAKTVQLRHITVYEVSDSEN